MLIKESFNLIEEWEIVLQRGKGILFLEYCINIDCISIIDSIGILLIKSLVEVSGGAVSRSNFNGNILNFDM